MREIFVTKPSLPPIDEYISEIGKIWQSGILTNGGPEHGEFEKQLAERTGCGNVSLFANGHLALEYGLRLLGVKSGDEVITVPFTFVSTVNAIEALGAKPVFCDIRKDNLTMDPGLIEEKITEKTKAILPVHVYGNICDTERIGKTAKKYNIPVLYDGAHAFGEKKAGKDVASLGDITMFSFHATKVLGCGEGGALFFNGEKGEELKEKADSLKNFGLSSGDCREAGGNAKMSEFAAALGICNLKHIEEYISARKKIFDIYKKNLKGTLEFLSEEKNGDIKRNYAYAPVAFESEERLTECMNRLEENKIHTRRYFYPGINNMSFYREKYGPIHMPESDKISERVLCLPLGSDMTEEEAENICKIIAE